MDKSNYSESFYHLRNWENYDSNNNFFIDYTTDVNWVYENRPSAKIKWTVWDGGYDGYNVILREDPFPINQTVYHYDATPYQVSFIQNTINEVDKHIEPDFEYVEWGTANADIYIWLTDHIGHGFHGIGLFHGLKSHGTVEAIVDVTKGGRNYQDWLIAHELGHCFGLSHPGVNGVDSPKSNLYNSKDTIMSYNPDENGEYGTSYTELDIKALQSIWGAEGSYGGINFNINNNSPVVSEQNISSHSIGSEYELYGITDYNGNLHADTGSVSNDLKSAYKYQGNLDVNKDGISEAIYTNRVSGRWATGSLNSGSNSINFSDHGKGGTTRIVGIYIDPLVTSGEVVQYSDHDSQHRFQNDLKTDNLLVKRAGDYDNDGFQEIYWKTADGTAYLRSLMHSDGNIQYANYQSEAQMSNYLTNNGYGSIISDIN